MKPTLVPSDAILVVDVQNDFCPGGRLAIDGGDEVASSLNDWIDAAVETGATVAASCDQHPAGHVSFEEQGGPWPEHCVQGTEGARFCPKLRLPETAIVVEKGQDVQKDQHSAFDGTDLALKLRDEGVRRVFIGGLALDVCVHASALDSVKNGFETHLILDACRPTSVEAGEKTVDELIDAGVHVNVARHQEGRA